MIGDVRHENVISQMRAPPCLNYVCHWFIKKILGVIDCEHPQKHYYNDAHLEILSTVAHLLSAKIDQVRTVKNLKQTVNQLNDAQKLENCMLQIANLTYQSSELDSFFESLHAIITTLLRADNFFIGLYDKNDVLDIVYIIEEGVRLTHTKKSLRIY